MSCPRYQEVQVRGPIATAAVGPLIVCWPFVGGMGPRSAARCAEDWYGSAPDGRQVLSLTG